MNFITQTSVGLPKICSTGDVAKIQRKDLLDYYNSHFIPSRMVLVGKNSLFSIQTWNEYINIILADWNNLFYPEV